MYKIFKIHLFSTLIFTISIFDFTRDKNMIKNRNLCTIISIRMAVTGQLHI